MRRKPKMHGHEKSDGRVVPTKPPNNGGGPLRKRNELPTAEEVEERRPAKENSMQRDTYRTQGRVRVQQALQRVREAVNRDRRMRLTALYHHIHNVDMLREAYYSLKRNVAAGVDGVTWEKFGEGLEERLQGLSERLRKRAYRAHAVRRVQIPKLDGQKRSLGVTTLEDKIVQVATVKVLNTIYERDFLGFSYGFRPGRSQHNALDALVVGIERGRVGWVLDLDIRAFFDRISHEWMAQFIEHRIADQRVVRLIQKWLKADVLEDGERTRSEIGTPQGASISPLLANIYLHYAFDLWAHAWRHKFSRGNVRIVRYADDIVVGFEYRQDAERFLAELRDRLAKFGLELHPTKTRLLEFGRFAAANRRRKGEGKPETFEFLGLTHICGESRKGNFRIERQTSRKRMRQKLKEIKRGLMRRRHLLVREQGAWLRSVLSGHYRYYGVPHNSRALHAFHRAAIRHWRRALSRRSQKGRISRSQLRQFVMRWLPRPRICHPYPIHRFSVRIQGRSPVR